MPIENLLLFDDPQIRTNMLPFTFTRPVCDIRVGILTIREKWEYLANQTTSTLTSDYLAAKFPPQFAPDNTVVNGCVLPNADLLKAISDLEIEQGLVKDGLILAARVEGDSAALDSYDKLISTLTTIEYTGDVLCIQHPWEIFTKNAEALDHDFKLLTAGEKKGNADEYSVLINPERIFIHPTAKVSVATLNASSGPIYIGPGAEVMEGSLIRGPFALCESSILKMGAKIYGATTIGPHCKVGGEVNNSVIFGYSNKAHDGFLGNSVIGEWCNLGADTNNSNLKNNYGPVSIWSYEHKAYRDTGLQFCGLFMADHAKCGINTMFNTGTVVGTFANVFGGDFPPKFIPSFTWGGDEGATTYHLKKAFEVAERVMMRRGLELTDVEKAILTYIFEETVPHRKKI